MSDVNQIVYENILKAANKGASLKNMGRGAIAGLAGAGTAAYGVKKLAKHHFDKALKSDSVEKAKEHMTNAAKSFDASEKIQHLTPKLAAVQTNAHVCNALPKTWRSRLRYACIANCDNALRF